MTIKGLVEEDFVNYKVPSMFIITSYCTFKCDKESGTKCCQNSSLVFQKNIHIRNEKIVERYINNPISEAVVFGGLEPMDQFADVIDIIKQLRTNHHCNDDVVIYTGYYEKECVDEIETLKTFPNVVIKFGRFIPNHEKHYDEVLGVYLSSDNQYAKRIS